MPTALRILAGLAGFVLVLAVWRTAVLTLVVPRTRRWLFLYSIWVAAIRRPVVAVARRLPYSKRDTLLAPVMPFVLVSLVPFWLLLFGVGYGLLFFALGNLPLLAAFREAGSSLFTLGFSEPSGRVTTLAAFLAAITGPLLIALLIGYLPTLYGSFNRRETEVSMLAGRGGDPVWGPIILVRYQWSGLVGELATLYADWERWAADISESHTSYPALVHFRSPNPNRSWITSLLAVMDAAAIQLSRAPSTAPGISRLAITGGAEAIRSISEVLHLPVIDDPHPEDPISIDEQEWHQTWEILDRVGFPAEVDVDTAWHDFRGWRVNYEKSAFALARYVHAPPLEWTGPRDGDLPLIPREVVRNRSYDDPEGTARRGQPPARTESGELLLVDERADTENDHEQTPDHASQRVREPAE